MQDAPEPTEILAAVAAFLRGAVATAAPHVVFQARVAANALDLVARQLALAPAAEAQELARLRGLLGRDGTLTDLNAALAAALAAGSLDAATPAVAAHLHATTMAKLAVDQPSYASYRAALAEKDA